MQDIRRHLIALTAVVALWMGLAAAHPQPRVNVVTQQTPPATGATFRSVGAAPSASTGTGCQGLSPGPEWTCANGTWQLASLVGAAAGTGAGAGGAGGCQGAQPGANYACQGGVWVPEGGAAPASPATPTTSSTSATGCLATPPTPDWICRFGMWTPPAQSATPEAGSTSADAGRSAMVPVSSATPTSVCTSPSPGPSYVCQGGVWTLR